MYITTGTSKHYAVTAADIGSEVRYTLETAPAALGATVSLYTADGTLCLRTDTVADYRHPRIDGGTVILSSTPEPEPVEPMEPEPTGPTVEDDLLETALDHEARLSALELLGGGEI